MILKHEYPSRTWVWGERILEQDQRLKIIHETIKENAFLKIMKTIALLLYKKSSSPLESSIIQDQINSYPFKIPFKLSIFQDFGRQYYQYFQRARVLCFIRFFFSQKLILLLIIILLLLVYVLSRVHIFSWDLQVFQLCRVNTISRITTKI